MTNKETFIVYMATNAVNGKRYIGATRKGMHSRRNHHFKDARRKGKARDCPRFYDAIRKYGNSSFEWSVLATLSSAEEMFKEEERLIAEMKPEYNIASGGLIFTSNEKQKEFLLTNSQRCSKKVICLNDGTIYPSIKAAERAYGLKDITTLCQRGGISTSGLSFAILIGTMSEQERTELLMFRKDKKIAAEQARIEKVTRINSRPVTDLNTGMIYASATVADRALKLVLGTVEACCRRKRANRDGDCFAFGQLSKRERLHFLALTMENRRTIDAGWKEKIGKKHSRIVICENDHMLYDNPKVAAIDYGLSAWTIYTHCRSGKPTQSGLSFSYLDEWCHNPE